MSRSLRMAVILSGLLLSACAGRDGLTEAGFRRTMDRWLGEPKERLVQVFGQPRLEGTDGGAAFVAFDRSWTETGGGYTRSMPQTEYVTGTNWSGRGRQKYYSETRTTYVDDEVPSYSVRRECLVSFYLNPAGRTFRYDYVGDGCVSGQ